MSSDLKITGGGTYHLAINGECPYWAARSPRVAEHVRVRFQL